MNNKIDWWVNVLDESDVMAVSSAMRNKSISQGELTHQFERELAQYLNVPYVVCASSGSAALAMAYYACGLRVGDEILTSNVTFVATANAALLFGAKVRAVDVNVRNVIDENSIESQITEKTKILVPVHMNACSCNMDKILEIVRAHNVEVVEDACQAFSSKYSLDSVNKGKYLGTFGRFGCFSLGMAKLLTTGGGGFIVAHTQEDAELLKKIRNQGVLDVRKTCQYHQFGFNFKFTDLQASIGLNQLKNIEGKIQRAKEIYMRYKDALGGYMQFLESDIENGEIPMRVVALTKHNERLKDYLLSKNIVCALESQPLSNCSYMDIKGDFVHSDYFEKHKLILPSGPSRSFEEVDIVCEAIIEFFKRIA
ncbi:DegT/DnrJ/EryC1/StrS family aminotransferase [Helicobacter sp.]|uniref:DegT/DnrJ/EryC1/StrS family aminotransferase n=1 Tax=Helicobacter sp. TaxID=218 RepID=UPI0025BB7029|nr:DegT/DnrJ/EryC1/StrS family aminotransferase [Helicobacter sp.]MCI5968210.1 DegT/DnrJ/EryC1/StrS family aminotransferase [Helicobacter sp.]MDY2584363.1 DegT/DnrJ/EryC1/StrS family aminotransferase [Helicobacter sp.]